MIQFNTWQDLQTSLVKRRGGRRNDRLNLYNFVTFSILSDLMRSYRKTNCVPKFSAFPATLLLLRDIASCFTRRFALVCGVSLVAGASYGIGRNNVCSSLETPSLANACGYSRQPFYMTAVERQLQQQPDLVDPLSCPHASNALIKVRKHSLSQRP